MLSPLKKFLSRRSSSQQQEKGQEDLESGNISSRKQDYPALNAEESRDFERIFRACEEVVATTTPPSSRSSPIVSFHGCRIGGKPTILIVSRSPSYSASLKKMLKRRGILGEAKFQVLCPSKGKIREGPRIPDWRLELERSRGSKEGKGDTPDHNEDTTQPRVVEPRGYGGTPLWRAAQNGHEVVVKLLLDKGADVEAMDDKDGGTPLWHAAGKGHEAVVKLLLDNGADVEAKDISGQTSQSWAVENGHEAVARLLR